MDTKLAKPAVSEEKVPTEEEKIVKPAEILWCIHHNAWTKAEKLESCGLGHVQVDGDTLDYCCYPDGWAFTAPPEVDEWSPDQPEDDDFKAERELQEMGQWLPFE